MAVPLQLLQMKETITGVAAIILIKKYYLYLHHGMVVANATLKYPGNIEFPKFKSLVP
ncbi:MAG: hypothetical protein ABF633_04320 [Clostridium sp.]|uniref:hypothetical protein n=1 Tax=Clostridium sp. TaxID=1506 RepID=UPI0039ECB938